MSESELSSRSSSGITVLLVDDDEDSRFVYGLGLEHAGFRVLLAADGEEGLRLARAHHPDAAVLDVELPLMGGLEVMRALRQGADVAARDTALIAVTARALLDGGGALLADGFDRVLFKPVTPAKLASEVLGVLQARAGTRAPLGAALDGPREAAADAGQ